MKRAKSLILSAAIAVFAVISLAAARPAHATLLYATDFNSYLAGTQVTSTELSGLPWNTGPMAADNPSEGWAGTNSGVLTAVHGGTQYGFMNASPAFGGGTLLGPTFTETAGITYTVTAYMLNVAGSTNSVIPILSDLSILSNVPQLPPVASTGPLAINTVGAMSDVPAATFTKVTLTWTPSTSGDFTFYFSNQLGGTTLLSYVSVTGAPEASTVIGLGAMLALGGLFLLAPRKRVSKMAA